MLSSVAHLVIAAAALALAVAASNNPVDATSTPEAISFGQVTIRSKKIANEAVRSVS